ncbi:MAG: hypothetical protein OEV92_10935 [Nitrospinota bacterium]|nr:hypothetical protein [Nitrospinota bacterium]
MSRSSVTATWLYAAVVSIMFMGIYAFLIALSRAPGFGALFPTQDSIRVALITHVVLSVVIWFLAFILFMAHRWAEGQPASRVEYLPAAGALLGIAMIVVTPFTGQVTPILNNYVPVLDSRLYLSGVGLFLLSAAAGWIMLAPRMMKRWESSGHPPPLVVGSLLTSGFCMGMGILSIALAYWQLREFAPHMEARFYYESLFWGGGHTLQLANSMGLLAAWGILAAVAPGREDEKLIPDGLVWAIMALMILFALAAPVEYFIHPADSQESRDFFTDYKRLGAGIGPLVVGLAAVMTARRGGLHPVAARGIYLSFLLFTLGALISLTLQGTGRLLPDWLAKVIPAWLLSFTQQAPDTRTPAHYHGIIGAVTLGFMTYALRATGQAGWLRVSQRWQMAQVTLYGAGQTVFVTGLFIGGLAKLPRKTFGAAQELDTILKKVGMGVMGVGGLLAVAGGVMFVVFMLKAFFSRAGDETAV